MEAVEVRTGGDAASMTAEVEQAVRSLAPNLPVFEVKTLRQSLYSINGLLLYEVVAAVAAVMGGLGLVLAIVGVYGVLSYVVQQKTGEIGVRMALGARPGDVLRMVYRQGLRVVSVGLVGGLAVSLALAHFVRSMLEVSPVDGVTYVGVSALLTVVALVACWVPARRATLVDPMRALRTE